MKPHFAAEIINWSKKPSDAQQPDLMGEILNLINGSLELVCVRQRGSWFSMVIQTKRDEISNVNLEIGVMSFSYT